VTPAACEEVRAGGVLRMKVNERSSKIVIWAGMTCPTLSAVLLVVRLRELDDVDAMGTQRRTDGRGGCRLPGVQLEGDDDADLLRHVG